MAGRQMASAHGACRRLWSSLPAAGAAHWLVARVLCPLPPLPRDGSTRWPTAGTRCRRAQQHAASCWGRRASGQRRAQHRGAAALAGLKEAVRHRQTGRGRLTASSASNRRTSTRTMHTTWCLGLGQRVALSVSRRDALRPLLFSITKRLSAHVYFGTGRTLESGRLAGSQSK